MLGRGTWVIASSALACALVLCIADSARADHPLPRWLAGELAWAEQAIQHPTPVATTVPSTLWSIATLSPTAAATELPVQTDASLSRERGRYHTMKVAGYLLAASTLAISLAVIPLFMKRQEHVDSYGEEGCGPNAFPYVAAPLFAAGLAVGITGSLRDRRFVTAHGATERTRIPWRVALAGTGVGLALSGLLASIVGANVCSS